MPDPSKPVWRFASLQDAEIESLPGKTHYWLNKPGVVQDTNLILVRAKLPPGACHNFHYHPEMEEILYILSGQAEQWVEKEFKMMRAGDSFYVPKGVVHATFNTGADELDFLAILSPAKTPPPMTVEVGDQEPWSKLRVR